MRRYRLVVGLDFDGTLAPFAPRPELARLPPAARAALEALAARPGVLVGVLSGRALGPLRRKVGLRALFYSGNHGLEVRAPGLSWRHPGAARARAAVAAAVRLLTPPPAGGWVEGKGLSLSVHGRAPAVPRAPGLRATHGKDAWELRPRLAWDKGDALLLVRRRLAPGAALVFIGDDANDEEAFRTLGRRAVTVKVGPGRTGALFRLRDPRAVARFLADLAASAPA